MAKGGARINSGPAKDPTSRTSERSGYTLTSLPSEGYRKRPPAFPLPKITRYAINNEGYSKPNRAATESFRKRELAIWAESWKTPQACAWAIESWRWPVVAEFCRLKVIVELDPSANAALVTNLRQYRDQIGFTDAGMKANGWAIAKNEVGARAAERAAANEPSTPTRRPRRLRSVGAE